MAASRILILVASRKACEEGTTGFCGGLCPPTRQVVNCLTRFADEIPTISRAANIQTHLVIKARLMIPITIITMKNAMSLIDQEIIVINKMMLLCRKVIFSLTK